MTRCSTIALLVVAMLGLILLGCQAVEGPTPTPAPSAEGIAGQAEDAAAILDTTWTVQSFGSAENPIPGVDGAYPSINFLLARFNGYTGCNYFVGTYHTEGDRVLFEPPAVTTGFCDDEQLHQQQETFMTILVTANRYEFDGSNISLFADDRQLMTLEPLEPVPFEDTTWNYRFFQGEMPHWQQVIPGTEITAVFEGDMISGSAGCNDYTGTVTRNGDELSIGELVITRKMCTQPEEIMDQEERYLSALQTVVSIRQSARSIELFDPDKPVMLFNAD